jgi:hypothetical protein
VLRLILELRGKKLREAVKCIIKILKIFTSDNIFLL